MKIYEFLKRWRHGRIVKKARKKNPKKEFRSGRTVWWNRGDYTLSNSELLFAAVSRIANALSAMPLHLYHGDEVDTKNSLNRIMSRSPNGSTTSCNWIKSMEACRDTSGNAYGLKILDNADRLKRIDILDPSKVTPILEKGSGELWYRIRPDEGKDMLVHNFYVVHIPFISTNGLTGVSPVSVLQDTLAYAENIQTFSRDQLDKGVNAAIVLEAPANLGETQRVETVNAFMETYRETSGNILLLESGVTAKSLDMSPVDTRLFEVEKITRSKVAMVYNLPPHLLGDYSDTSFSSQEQQMLEFLTLTMLPIVTAWEQELNRKLLTDDQMDDGYEFRFDMDSILRADAETQANVDEKAVRGGWTTVDEIRHRRHKKKYDGGIGNQPLVSQDLAPLKYTVEVKPKVLASKLDTEGEPQ